MDGSFESKKFYNYNGLLLYAIEISICSNIDQPAGLMCTEAAK
jgi:hypothetical protein